MLLAILTIIGIALLFVAPDVGLIVLAFVGYMLPGLIAMARRHHNETAILALNFLLGWTLLGWVGALVWSLTSPPSQPRLN